MKKIDLTIPTGAIFSDDGQHRYALWRVWSQVRQPLMFIGLNPSTANGTMNDPTITRLMVRAELEGFGGLLAGNLYALVSSIPSPLTWREDAIGDEADDYIRQMVSLASRVLCAWGSFPAAKKRVDAVLNMIPEPYCLGINGDGQPKHPLYIPYSTKMVKMELK